MKFRRSGVGLAVACTLAMLLSGCASRRTSAPVVERKPLPAAVAIPPAAQTAPVPGAAVAPGGTYLVKRGDTLYSIALDHGVDHRDVARWSRLENPARIQVGQVLRVAPPQSELPVQVGAARGAGVVTSRPLDTGAAGTPIAGATRTEPKALRLPYSSENLAMLQKNDAGPGVAGTRGSGDNARPEPAAAPAPAPPVPPPAAKPAAEPRDADGIEFVWPTRGKLLAGFAEPTNKGLDIGGRPGDPVVAAAPGRVIYVGSGIRGYGKLIVIKHDNNFNSVYAHNREILVKQDQSVARGQKIAELGDTDADVPKLHFEIRKSGKPVDPAKYLPAAPPS